MIYRLFITLATMLLLSCGGGNGAPDTEPAQGADDTQRLNTWFAEKNEERLAFSPVELTTLGRKEHYGEIDQLSDEAVEQYLAWHSATLEEMEREFSYEALDFEARTSWDLWVYMYERIRDQYLYRNNEYIFEQMDGLHAFFPTFMINYHRVDTLDDMQAYISRLNEIGRALAQELDKARSNAELGVRPPRFAYEIVMEEIRKIISGEPFNDVENDSAIWTDSRSKLSALIDKGEIDPETADELNEQVRTALLESYQPAYAQVLAWLSQDIENSDEEPRGVWALPDGASYYNQLLAFYTTTTLSAAEIHQIGLDEVDRIWAEMEAVKQDMGFDGEMLEFFEFISTDEQFYYPNTDAGRRAYLDETRAFYDFIRQELPNYFGILPKAPLEVKRVESFREQAGAPAHYFPSSPDGTIPGVYYVHMSEMSANPIPEMESTAYHEGIPGHHLQIAISRELTTVPDFRGQIFYNAYGEGWALYAEQLASEMGAYVAPSSNFGRLSNEMWRAVRLVVDTGMHAMGWTREEAINYFAAHTISPIESIVAEINRYLVLPGQATSYKIGMLKILELRERASEALGDAFDIRDFHDVVLGGGALPLDVLERRVDNYIALTQNGEI